jgi:hypothetical protein
LNLAPALAAPGRAEDVRAVVAWHVGWTLAAAVVTVAAHWLSPGLKGTVLSGLIGMILPGLAGLWLARSDGLGDRALVLGVWSLAAVAASALSGGVTGSLSAFVFTPLVAGILLGGRILSLTGAFAVALSRLWDWSRSCWAARPATVRRWPQPPPWSPPWAPPPPSISPPVPARMFWDRCKRISAGSKASSPASPV